MTHMPPGRPPAPSSPPKWLWAVPVFSCGLLAFVPALVIAAKLKERTAWQWAGAITATWFVGFALVGSQPDDGSNAVSTFGALLYIAAWIGGVVYSLAVGPKVNWSTTAGPPTPPPYNPNSAAVAGVQDIRRRRDEARDLARRDPSMARDLRIGRPDLPRHYDDGGLVDVNSAPASTMEKWLGLSAEQATSLVGARGQLGRFQHMEDLINLAGLDLVTYDHVKDRMILM